jgi:hypothetical protein
MFFTNSSGHPDVEPHKGSNTFYVRFFCISVVRDVISATSLEIPHDGQQGCQMAYFQTKNPNLGKFWKVLQWKMLVFLLPFFLLTTKLYILMDI